MELKVGDLRKWSTSTDVFEILAIGSERVFIKYLESNKNRTFIEDSFPISTIHTLTTPYQEPKPVRKLKAFEHGNGTIVLRYCDKTNDLEFSSNFRKLSDSELKELIKGVIGE